MLRTAVAVVRRKMRGSPSSSSTASVVSETWTVTVCPGVGAAEGQLLAADHDHAAVRGPTLNADRLGGGSRRRPSRPVPAEPAHLLVAERVWPDPEQLAALEVEENQRVGLDPDADLAAAEDLRGQDDVSAEADQPGFGDDPLDLDRRTMFDRRQG